MELFIDEHPQEESVRSAVMEGLGTEPRSLPPRLFYDEEGSRLFDAITRLPEYYLTRTEIGILSAHAGEMVAHMAPHTTLIEYGSGSSTKTDLVLRQLRADATYIPVDISREHLLRSSEALAKRFPGLTVLPVCADFHSPLPHLSDHVRDRGATVFFPGSTIGNLEPEHAVTFLRRASALLGSGGGLLIGMDMRKDRDRLLAAYDDPAGVTAAFNLNMLRHVNRVLGPVFDVDAFRHRAVWNEAEGRVEMHLVATRDQVIRVGSVRAPLRAGEAIVTEYSYKYTMEQAQLMLASGGFATEEVWTDPDSLFSVHFARVP